MSRHRISLHFDLDINDEQEAQALAADTMHQVVEQHEGQFVSSRGESPEVAVHGMARHERAVASAVALRMLAMGAATLPWVEIKNYEVSNEPMGQ